MKINKTKDGNKLTIALTGRLDTITAPELENELTGSLEGVTDLIFDFTDLEYISSAGLRILLLAHKTMLTKGTMKVIHINEIISEIFEVTGFADVLTIE